MIIESDVPMANSATQLAPNVLAIRGYLSTDPSVDSPGAAYSEIAKWVAAHDPAEPLTLDIDSPGGDVTGVEALARLIAARPGHTTARVTGMAASAAYWLACGCDEIIADPSASIGSVGTTIVGGAIDATEEDLIAKLSPRKNAVDGQMQILVDAGCERFLAFVAERRRMEGKNLKAIAKLVGEGAIMTAEEALKRGMIDKIMQGVTMDPEQMPTVETEGERSAEDRLAELEARHADLERRVAEVEAIVENLRREEDDTTADELETEAPADEAAAATAPALAAINRTLKSLRRVQRDQEIAALVACGAIRQCDIEVARLAYDANPALFRRRYGHPAAMSTPIRVSDGQRARAVVAPKKEDPSAAAWRDIADGKFTNYRAAYKAHGGK